MTGKELKALALKISDECEVLVEVEDAPEGVNLRRKFNIHAIRPQKEEAP